MSAVEISNIMLRHPLDLTGVSPDNYVEAEVRNLPSNQNRAIVLSNGPFYTESLKVYDNITGQLLTKRTQYIAAQLVETATTRSGKEVCSVLIITDPSVSGQVRVDYQCVGGPYILSIDALTSMIETLDIDERPVVWGQIIGKPNLFPPGHHLHDAGDVFGFEYMVLALEEIRKAILMGDIASHDEIYGYITNQVNMLNLAIDGVSDTLDTHQANVNNPHATTKTQVGLSNVQNYPVATKAEAEAGTAADRYMTPLRVKEAVLAQAGTLLQAHIDDKLNPHNTTKAQVGLSNVQNYLMATQAEAEAGTVNTAYMTPLRVGQAITALAVTPLMQTITAHANRVDNPHSTNKGQVGLGSVENYAPASNAEVAALSAVNKYVLCSSLNSLFGNLGNSAYMNVGTTGSTVAAGNHTHTALYNGSKSAILDATGNLTLMGDVVGFSDERLKKNWKRISNALDRVKMLEGGVFQRIDGDDEWCTGLLAQAVQRAMPEATKLAPNGFLTVAYGNLVGLLVEAIKDLAQQVEILQHDD